MNRQMLRNPYGALGLVAVTVAASFAATGCRGESGADIPTVGGSTAAATTTSPDSAWIAYSTAHVGDWRYRAGYGRHGSDVYMTRAGDQPKLVASRGRGEDIWNICPDFSPDGRLLAFARIAPSGTAIVVVRVARDGTTGAPRVVVKMSARRVPCPRWSSASSRVAYLDRSGRVVVRGLGGSRAHWRDGDPRARDFARNRRAVLSPTGQLIATPSDRGIVVSPRDGSDRWLLKDDPPSYAVAGWSPNGRELLAMRDVGGGFMMRAVSVDAPFVSTTVVAYVSVNNARSWPGYGDVSWQPMPHP